MGAEFELKLAEEQIAALKEALRLNKEENAKLERLARAVGALKDDKGWWFESSNDLNHLGIYLELLHAIDDCEGLY